MTKEEALKEWDRMMEVTPSTQEKVTPEATARAAKLFAAAYPIFEEKDEEMANLIINHSQTFIRPMARRFQTIIDEEEESFSALLG